MVGINIYKGFTDQWRRIRAWSNVLRFVIEYGVYKDGDKADGNYVGPTQFPVSAEFDIQHEVNIFN